MQRKTAQLVQNRIHLSAALVVIRLRCPQQDLANIAKRSILPDATSIKPPRGPVPHRNEAALHSFHHIIKNLDPCVFRNGRGNLTFYSVSTNGGLIYDKKCGYDLSSQVKTALKG